MKVCSRCKTAKPLDEFYNNSATKDGKTGTCGACLSARSKELRALRSAGKIPKPLATHKLCTICKVSKPRAEYAPRTSASERYLVSHCRACQPTASRIEWERRGYLRSLFSRYGVTPEQYLQMVQDQNGQCAICRTTDPGKKTWCVDHNHETGAVRGLLCSACNTGIGHLGDDIDRVAAALRYLQSYDASSLSRVDSARPSSRSAATSSTRDSGTPARAASASSRARSVAVQRVVSGALRTPSAGSGLGMTMDSDQ